MAFTPVLDIPVHRNPDPHRRVARAAGFALRQLATTDGRLLIALQIVDGAAGGKVADCVKLLRQAFPTELSLVADATGVAADDIERSLVGQLREVLEFANLDGGVLEANVGAVAGLIRSGRVELFAGQSPGRLG